MTSLAAIIRPATPADATAVSALLSASYGVLLAQAYEPAILAQALPVISRANPKLLASGSYFLATLADGRLAACGGWSADEPGTGRLEVGLGHIRHFATHPDHKGQGLGRRILQTCLDEMKARAIRRVECLSTLNGVGFYAAMGFAEIRPVDVMLPGQLRFPSVLMEQSLAA